MQKVLDCQETLFPNLTIKFPSTRYQGSKAKIASWIWEQIADLNFTTCLDAFGGTGAVAYLLKQKGKKVTYNDILRFNYYIGLAIIENDREHLEYEEIDWLLQRHPEIKYPSFIYNNFVDIYYTDIASDTTGSGNTKNIGSIKDIESLLKGKGVFEPYGQNIFDDYWMNYLTDDMARKIDSKVPYRNIKEYWKWKNR
ncbi:TPA: hypothetical protein ENX78_14910 [Candidatus Poribacteria bacterium]|nr:hypothetical protein [Candidatus Poribacteria bacterium]